MKKDNDNIVLSIAVITVVLFSLVIFFISEQDDRNYSDKQVFTDIYEKNIWRGGSGPGSKVKNAGPFLGYLQNFIDTQKISTIVDIGCGDWELMKTIHLPAQVKYLGLDIVDHVIAENQKKYTSDNVKFISVNNIEELSSYNGDLLIIKDVLQHWEKDKIFYAMKNIIPNFKYAIIVNCIKIPETHYVKNLDAKFGSTRIVDLKKAPFFMPNLKFVMDYELVTEYEVKRIYLYVHNELDPLLKE